ncbi:MAG: hypothetical protein JO314_08540 [Acidobacteria bacterium]|nr:hypothetical protein [Acidobacteriota bacterium]
MFYTEMTGRGGDGFTTHLMTWSFCVAFSHYLGGRPFYLSHEVPASTPPEYATKPEFRDRYGVLLRSPRSLVSNIVDMPANRVFDLDRNAENKLELQLLYSHFATTEEIRAKFGATPLWEFFSFGRVGHTLEEFRSYDLIEWTHPSCTNLAVFYWLPRQEKEDLLAASKIRFIPEIEEFVTNILQELGRFYSGHTRLGDFRKTYGSTGELDLDIDRYRKFIALNYPDESLPIVMSTDALHEREMFEQIFSGRKLVFLDEFIFDNYRDRYLGLEWRDFNVLSVLNQLVAAAGEVFVGTYRSTFTGMIHRLRQERHRYKDFNYFPDARVANLLNEQMKLAPDRSGFFDWNRFSYFIPDHASLAWRREWDFDLTSIDF